MYGAAAGPGQSSSSIGVLCGIYHNIQQVRTRIKIADYRTSFWLPSFSFLPSLPIRTAFFFLLMPSFSAKQNNMEQQQHHQQKQQRSQICVRDIITKQVTLSQHIPTLKESRHFLVNVTATYPRNASSPSSPGSHFFLPEVFSKEKCVREIQAERWKDTFVNTPSVSAENAQFLNYGFATHGPCGTEFSRS